MKTLELKLEQIRNEYKSDIGQMLQRIINPCFPIGCWPGTKVQIREWKFCPTGEAVFRNCTTEEMTQFENALGNEVDYILNHKTLGPVVVVKE